MADTCHVAETSIVATLLWLTQILLPAYVFRKPTLISNMKQFLISVTSKLVVSSSVCNQLKSSLPLLYKLSLSPHISFDPPATILSPAKLETRF